MDKYELNKNENSTAKAKALELALEYSFVTPLTSLVVVKPNDTATSASPEKIKPLNEGNNFPPIMMIGRQFNLPGPPGLSQPIYDRSILQASFFMTQGPLVVYPDSFLEEDGYGSESQDSFPTILSTQIANIDVSTPTTIIDSSHVLTDKSNSTTLHDIKELTWLNDSITLNATNTVYQISMNTSGQSYQNCTTPDQSHGNCKHLKDCVVASILNSFDTYLSLFCPIETLYAGICCLV
uniref:Clip domain-containing protein n=2 Tax=Schizaphis graminum TaxID=13262 RepID=A0A2S2PTV4_SCHGA